MNLHVLCWTGSRYAIRYPSQGLNISEASIMFSIMDRQWVVGLRLPVQSVWNPKRAHQVYYRTAGAELSVMLTNVSGRI